MQQSTRKACADVSSRKARRPAASSIGGIANGFLTIPAIDRQKLPVYSVSTADEKKWLELAKLCAHLVGDELELTKKSSAREIVAKALSAWASKHCSDVDLLDTFELIASLDVEDFGFYCDKDANFTPETHFWLGIQSHQMSKTINVGQALAALDEKKKGLAATALRAAEIAGLKTNGLFSPSFAYHQAQSLYWMGADNDKDYLEEAGGEAEDNNGIPLPSQFIAAFPDFCFGGKELDDDELKSLSESDESLKELTEAINAIRRLAYEGAFIPGMESCYGEPVYFSCYMRVCGEEHSLFDRVLDDFYEQTCYVSEYYTDFYGVSPVPKSEEAFIKWRDKLEKGFALYVQLDRLMKIIGEVKE